MLTRISVMLNMQSVTGYSCQHVTLDCKGPRKFRDRYVGPFRVIDRIGNTAYHLDLSGW